MCCVESPDSCSTDIQWILQFCGAVDRLITIVSNRISRFVALLLDLHDYRLRHYL